MPRRTAILLGAVLLLATAGRLALAAALPLVDDEAYYWTWSRHLAWGYPDHPPAIAGLIRLTTSVLGRTPLGVRAGAVVLSTGTALLLYDLGRLMFGAQAGALAAISYQIIPAFAVGGVFAFPDAPFVFFWVLTMWALWRARTWGRSGDWYAAGLALGLAALSKLPVVFLGISLLGFLSATASERPWWRRPEPYRAAALALLVVLPFVHWNAAHEWIAFEKARDPILWIDTGVPALNAAAFAAAQLAFYGPVTTVLLVIALAASLTAPRRRDPRFAFLLWTAIPILTLTWMASFDGIPKPHWHAVGFLIALIPAAALWSTVQRRRGWRFAVAAAAIVNLAVIGVLAVLPFRMSSPTAGELWGWDQVAAAVRKEMARTPSDPGRFVYTSRYQTAGQLEFYLGEDFVVTTALGKDVYRVWVNDQRLIDWNAVFVYDERTGPGAPLVRMFRRIEPLPAIEVTLNGRVARRFLAWRCYGFRGLPRPTVSPI